MAKAPVMPLFTDALIGDTTHLSAEQFGCYVLILIATWRNNGKALPDDDWRFSKICRITATKWRRKVRPILCEFFDISETGWHQQRLEKEWNRVSRWLSHQATRGRAGANARAIAGATATRGNHYKEEESLTSLDREVSARACVPADGAAHAHDTDIAIATPEINGHESLGHWKQAFEVIAHQIPVAPERRRRKGGT